MSSVWLHDSNALSIYPNRAEAACVLTTREPFKHQRQKVAPGPLVLGQEFCHAIRTNFNTRIDVSTSGFLGLELPTYD